MTSNEWLKGDIEGLRDDKLSFDSDEMDSQKFDWGDVAEVHSPRMHTYVLEDLTQIVGKATIDKETMTIETAEGQKVIPRAELMSIVPGKPSEWNWWAAKLSLGASLNAGNTEQVSYNGSVKIRREDPYTRTEVAYDGAFGKVSGEENQNRHEGLVRLDVFISRRLFITAASSTFVYDKFQNIELQAVPAAGIGYTLLKNKVIDWDVSLGLGYQYLSYLSTVAGQENPQNDMAVKLGTKAEIDITGDVDLDLAWDSILVPTTMGLTTHRATADLSIEITDIFDFDVTFTYSRMEEPATRADGTTPKSDDFQLIFSIGLDFGYD